MEIQKRYRVAVRFAWAMALALLTLLTAPTSAQGTTQAGQPASTVRWRVTAPHATLAWFAVLADLRLPGAGAFDFTYASSPRAAPGELARSLGASRESEILHFVPLYYPSADRVALAEALRVAAGEAAPAPRATLLVGALRQALLPSARRTHLPALAEALIAARPALPTAARIAAWQAILDTRYLPALAPWLVAEGLDAGRLLVAPALGAEGRLFAATADRTDNLVAVSSFAVDTVADAPLLAFTREICFPAVSRAAREAGLRAEDPSAARRASLAAVRCGAALLDRRLPDRAAAYRHFWLMRLDESGTPVSVPAASDSGALREAFARAFPPDPALSRALDRALRRIPPSR